MKKLLLALVVVSGFATSVYAQPEKATVVITDKPISDAVIVINILCNSSIDINKFSAPNNKVSLNFNDVECSKIVSIIENYGQSN